MSGKSSHHQQAEMAIQKLIHEKLVEALNQSDGSDTVGVIELAEAAVIEALNDPSISWAFAYVAGVVMAPEILSAHARPAQPSTDGGGSSFD